MRWRVYVCPECDKVLLGQDPHGLPAQCGWCKTVLRTRWEPTAPEPIRVGVVSASFSDEDVERVARSMFERTRTTSHKAGKAYTVQWEDAANRNYIRKLARAALTAYLEDKT